MRKNKIPISEERRQKIEDFLRRNRDFFEKIAKRL
jgi:hypothetical protein